MTNFIYDNTALYDDKVDPPNRPQGTVTQQWDAVDANLLKNALLDTRTAIQGASAAVSVKQFQAIGDGVTDDTAAIQAALDAAEAESAVVYLPRGLYLVSDTLFVPNKVVLIGIGRSTDSGIKASATFSTDGRPLVRLGRLTDTLVFGCRVEQVSLDCNSRAKVGLYSTAANEQSGARLLVVSNFTQYGIHLNGASIVCIENVEIYPRSGGATAGIYLQSCAGDNHIKRATLGVSGLLAKGLWIQTTQCIAESIHVENCTAGVHLDDSTAVLVGVSGPTVNANVPDLILVQANTRYNIGINLVKNSATRILTDNFAGITYAGSFLPIWVGGDALFAGSALGFYGAAPTTKPTVTGSRGGNAALASLLTALANLGLITNSTSA